MSGWGEAGGSSRRDSNSGRRWPGEKSISFDWSFHSEEDDVDNQGYNEGEEGQNHRRSHHRRQTR